MADGSDRRTWLGLGALVLGGLISGGLFLALGDADGDAPEPVSDDAPGAEAPPTTTEGEDGDGSTTGDAPDVEISDEAKAAKARLEASSTEGPTGSLTAVSLSTTGLPTTPGGDGLVSPRFSPKGTRIVAMTGGTGARSAWVAEVDKPAAGWIAVAADGPVTDVDWVTEDVLVVVREDKLFSFKLGGRAFALVDEADEPGKVIEPEGSPDGSKVAYISVTLTNGGGDLRVVDRTTAVVTDVAATRARVGDPSWRADGQAVVGTVGGQVTAWALDQSSPIARHPRPVAAMNPGWIGDGLHWQEGASFVSDLVIATPEGHPKVVARQALSSVARPAPVAAGAVWVASLRDPGSLWAVRPSGDAVVVDTDANFSSQPDVVEREDGVWVAFTNNDQSAGLTRVHIGRLLPSQLVP